MQWQGKSFSPLYVYVAGFGKSTHIMMSCDVCTINVTCIFVLSLDSQNMHKVFIRNYDKLINIFNTSVVNLSKHFVAKNVITIEDEEEIRNAGRDKSRLFLRKIEAPVRGGFTAGFHIMLDIMLQHGSVTDQQLAEQIRSEIDEECKNGKCIAMHRYIYVYTGI